MSDRDSLKNRVVWMDIPVVDLERASDFYSKVLNITVHQEEYEDTKFAILEHDDDDGNGGCLIINENAVSSDKGISVYMNVDGRIKDAVGKIENLGGKIINEIHSIGPHGFRAIVLDFEGNKIILHSNSDA